MVGCIKYLGEGKWELDDFEEIFRCRSDENVSGIVREYFSCKGVPLFSFFSRFPY